MTSHSVEVSLQNHSIDRKKMTTMAFPYDTKLQVLSLLKLAPDASGHNFGVAEYLGTPRGNVSEVFFLLSET